MIFALWHCTVPMPACRQAQGRADWQAGKQAGGQECLPGGKSESLQAGSCDFFTCMAAFGAVVAACGVFEPYFSHGKRPTFAPKRQGKAESAYRRPRLRPSFGQPEGIGRPIPLWDCYNRYIPNRRTKQEQSQARLNYVLQGGGRVTLNPSATDFCVLKDTARCPLSYSKGFGLLPKRPCPLRGGASSPKSGSLFPPAVRMPKLRLCRDTTKSIVI